jgi:hypothetical protein
MYWQAKLTESKPVLSANSIFSTISNSELQTRIYNLDIVIYEQL